MGVFDCFGGDFFRWCIMASFYADSIPSVRITILVGGCIKLLSCFGRIYLIELRVCMEDLTSAENELRFLSRKMKGDTDNLINAG